MSTHTVSPSRKAARRAFLAKARQCVLILVFLLSLLGMNPAETPTVQANGGWTAYNDCAGTSDGNVTEYTITSGNQTGKLIDFATGNETDVTVTISTSGSPAIRTEDQYGGAETNPGTDAYETFHDYVDMFGLTQYGSSSGWYIDVTFTGLNPARMYTFATSANRNDDSYEDRISKFTISDMDAAINASTEGVTTDGEHIVSFSTGYNTVNGYVARWTDIQPGSDGDFTVRVESGYSERQAYGPSVFQLIEMPTDLPQYTLSVGNDGNGSVTLDPPGGTYYEGTTVNLTPVGDSGFAFDQWSGPNAGDLTDNGDGTWSIVMDGDKQLAANFVVSMCSTVNLTSVADTRLRGSQATTNFGGEATVTVNANGDRYSQVGLIRWDLSSIPAGATIESASITLDVIDETDTEYPLYNLLRGWVEGTGTTEDTPSDTSANWNTYDGVNEWGTSGARSTSDRGETNLWDTTPITSTGLQTRDLNDDGVAMLQNWLTNPSSNYGFTLQNIASDSDYLEFSSKEKADEATWPKLNVTYCLPSTDPTIVVSGALSPFTSWPGEYSDAQSYTVSGVNLTGDISIAAPTGFALSLNDQDYFSDLTLSPSGEGIVAETTIFVRLFSEVPGGFSGNITHTSAGAASTVIAVSGTVSDDNRAPAKPALVSPTDGGTANLPPTLEVTVSDPDGDALDVDFYGREAGGASGEDFMLVYIPDPQNESQYAPEMFEAQTQWIVANKDAENIVFVTSAGDMVNTSSSHEQYQNADAAVDILDAGGVWYTMAPGNHDSAYGTSYYADYFGLSRYDDYLYEDGYWFGGGYDDLNTYSLFSASGNDFILINLQYDPPQAAIDWVDALLKTFSDRRAIVSQHDILNVNDSWYNQDSFNALKDNPNLFLMLCGHMHQSGDGAAYREETGTNGQTIHVVLADYQDMSNGNGYLRLLRFSPADDTIYMTTYSPYSEESITTYPDEMVIDYDLAAVGEPFELIGTAENISSGSNASIVWNGLTAGVEYEWYAVAKDGELESTSDVWSFTTSETANQAPVITEGPTTSVTMSEDGDPTAFDLTLNATDGDGDALTWSILTPAAHGTATASGTGLSKAIGFAPEDDYFGSDSFVVQVSDGKGGTDIITVNVTIEPVNDAPVIIGQDPLATDEDTALTLALTDLAVTDPDNKYPDDFSLTVLAGDNYSVDGSAITPTANYNGSLTVPVKVNDGQIDSNTYNLTVTVNPVNDAPVAVDDAYTTNVNTTLTVAAPGVLANDTDVESDPLDIVEFTQPEHGTVTLFLDGSFTYVPNTDWTGTDSFAYKASDGEDTSNVATVTIVVGNGQVPVLPSSFYGEIHILDNPPDAGDTVEVSIPGVDSPVSTVITAEDSLLVFAINVEGDVSGTPEKEGGIEDDPLIFRIDGRIVATSTWRSGTNTELNLHPPQPVPGEPYAGDVGTAISFTGSADDWGSDAVTYQWDWENDGTFDASGANASHTWNEVGSYTAALKVIDAQGGEGLATFNVTVNNAAPILNEIGDQSVDELTLLEFTASATDLDPLTFSLIDAPAGASIDNDGNFTWTPTEAQGPDDYDFTVSVCDNGTPSLCDSEEITVTVNEVNQAPALDPIGPKSVDELALLSFTVTATDADLPANTLTFSLNGDAPDGAEITQGGEFTWTPTEEQGPGTYEFTVIVSDGTATDSGTITVTVAEVNQAPVLSGIGDQSVNEGEQLSFTASATDADLPANTLTFSLDGAPEGAAINPSTGVFTWTPTEAQGPASYEFDIIVSDGEATDSETITVNVAEVNQAPVLQSIGDKTVLIGDTLNFTATATDADRPDNILTFSLVDAPSGATIDLSTGAFTWTPAEIDEVSFTVRVCDNGSPVMCDSEEITVSVTDTTITHKIDLVAGWNLISFNVRPDDTNITAVLSSIAGKYSLVYAWDASGVHAGSGNWLKYDPSLPAVLNTLDHLDETMGFWIHMTAADTLEVTGEIVDESDITLSTDAGGWNLVGYPSAANRSLPEALTEHGVGENFSLVYTYLANNPADPWKLFDPDAPGYPSDLKTLSPGLGYWISITEASTWTVNYRGE